MPPRRVEKAYEEQKSPRCLEKKEKKASAFSSRRKHTRRQKSPRCEEEKKTRGKRLLVMSKMKRKEKDTKEQKPPRRTEKKTLTRMKGKSPSSRVSKRKRMVYEGGRSSLVALKRRKEGLLPGVVFRVAEGVEVGYEAPWPQN